MPRKNPIEELQAEEAATSSPIRRSTRISTTSTPTRVMTRRTSSDAVTTAGTPKATKGRRLSASQETNVSQTEPAEEAKPGPKTRRAGSVTKTVEKDTEVVETSSRPRTRGSSVTKDEPQEVKKPVTRRRSSSTTEVEEPPIMLTRTRSGSITREASDTKPVLRRRRSSLTDEVVSSPAVSAMKRTNSMDTINVLDAIKEADKDEDSPKAQKGKKRTEINKLDLSVINESSFVEDPEKSQVGESEKSKSSEGTSVKELDESAEDKDSEKAKILESSLDKSKTAETSFSKDSKKTRGWNLNKSKSKETSFVKDSEESKALETSFEKDLDEPKPAETSIVQDSEQSETLETSLVKNLNKSTTRKKKAMSLQSLANLKNSKVSKDLNKSETAETSSVEDLEKSKSSEAGSSKGSEKSFTKSLDDSKTDPNQTGDSIHLPLNSTNADSSNQGEANNNSLNNSSDKENSSPQKEGLPAAEKVESVKNVFAEASVGDLEPAEPMEVDDFDLTEVDPPKSNGDSKPSDEAITVAESQTSDAILVDDETILDKSASPSFDDKWSPFNGKASNPRRSPRLSSSKSDQRSDSDNQEISTSIKRKVSLEKGEIPVKSRLSLKKIDESSNVEVGAKSPSLDTSTNSSAVISESINISKNALLKSPVVKIVSIDSKLLSPKESKKDVINKGSPKINILFEKTLVEGDHVKKAAEIFERRTSPRKSHPTSEESAGAAVLESPEKTAPTEIITLEEDAEVEELENERVQKKPEILQESIPDNVSDIVDLGTAELDVSEMLESFQDKPVDGSEQLEADQAKSTVEISDDDSEPPTSVGDDSRSENRDKVEKEKSRKSDSSKKGKRKSTTDSSDGETLSRGSQLVIDTEAVGSTEGSFSNKDSKDIIDLEESEAESIEQVSDFLKTRKNLTDELDSLIEGGILEEDTSESEAAYNEFIDDLAEEGEEDTPSDDSNDIIDLGEAINTESEVSSDDHYESDSFITDEEHFELLSGNEEFDLSLDTSSKSKMKNKSSNKKSPRSASSDDRKSKAEDDESSEKSPVRSGAFSGCSPKSKEGKSSRWARIIRATDSSDEEVIEGEEATENGSQIGSRRSGSSVERKLSASNDTREATIDSVGNGDSTKEIVSISSSVITRGSQDGASSANDSFSSKKSCSIIIHENIRVDSGEQKRVSDRIHKFVDLFCSNIKHDGEVSVNVSVDYASQDEENAEPVKISPRKSLEGKQSGGFSLKLNAGEKVKTPVKAASQNQTPVGSTVSDSGLMNLSISSDNVFQKNQDGGKLSKKSRKIETFPKEAVASPRQELLVVPVVEAKETIEDDAVVDHEDVEAKLTKKELKRRPGKNKRKIMKQLELVTGEKTLEEEIEEPVVDTVFDLRSVLTKKRNRKRKSSEVEDHIPVKKNKKTVVSSVEFDEKNVVPEFTPAEQPILSKKNKRRRKPALAIKGVEKATEASTKDTVGETRASKRKLAEADRDEKVVKRNKKTDKELLHKKTLNVLNEAGLDSRMQQVVPEYKPRVPRVQPGWSIETAVVKPSVSNIHQGEKFHSKDFKNKMLYDPKRVKRVETKQVLKKRNAFI